MCGWGGMAGGWVMMFLMMVFGLLVFVGFLLIVAALARRFYLSEWRPGGSQTALDVLKMRYARGEISKEEFERMKQDLS